jgi:hypothetical protein
MWDFCDPSQSPTFKTDPFEIVSVKVKGHKIKKTSLSVEVFSDPAGIRTQDPPDQKSGCATMPPLRISCSIYFRDFLFLISSSLFLASFKSSNSSV